MAHTASLPGALPGGLLVLPSVYRPQYDTHLLADALAREELGPGRTVLEIGTGTGALALQAARRGAAVTAVDVSWPAVLTARANALVRRLPLSVLHGDFETRTAHRRYDLVLTNPPYVPAPAPTAPVRGARRAWDAGRDGRLLIDRIRARAPYLLRPDGSLLMVHSAMCDPATTLDRLTAAGLSAEITARATVPWGPVLRSRRAWLRRQGLAAEAEDSEELVVVRARL
ncbi:HemK2/MTQ2 family protein methyltransferase [Streptomyces sp. NPDC097619]|uniref:HemK2/MTQ2 family protein methyltransferase n=1 Tax=Streptomyces sp. NPDC097619 TaxID=3157228 RepID=UPI00331A990A